ncbi:MAG: class I SAM-dependent methyltransferase [Gammaproteobacteria bacterium]|nr:class I SAM-dependent methyltransferase [Gammaproteobacteria bacterium]
MATEKPTERFSDHVKNYVRYRPDYPEELIDYLIKYSSVNGISKIADIGSGTGKFCRYLLDRNLNVTAVEPNRDMRQAAESLLSDCHRFTSISGTAEDTTLDDCSVDLVTVAQAFHWFDWPKTLGEFKRILKTGGQLALIWNRRDLSDPFQIAYENMLRTYAPEYNAVNHMNIENNDIRLLFTTDSYHSKVFRYTQYFDCEAFLGRMQSSSYTPPQGSAGLTRLNQAAIVLFAEYAVDGRLSFHYRSHLYQGELS